MGQYHGAHEIISNLKIASPRVVVVVDVERPRPRATIKDGDRCP